MRYWMLRVVLVAVVVVGGMGCSSPQGEKEKKEAAAPQISLAEVPGPARSAIEKLTAGGEIRKIEKAQERGKIIYDVEATVGDKDVEYDVAEDGTVLTRQESVPFASLPVAVQAAAEKYFGSTDGLKASQEIEGPKTYYEVGGKKKDKTLVTLKFSDTGRILEKEVE
jgi:uncharacterized membrane protein YkoI